MSVQVVVLLTSPTILHRLSAHRSLEAEECVERAWRALEAGARNVHQPVPVHDCKFVVMRLGELADRAGRQVVIVSPDGDMVRKGEAAQIAAVVPLNFEHW